VDVKRAADVYAQGQSLRQIGAALGVPWTAVGHQLRSAGVPMRRSSPPAHPASTDQTVELRDQGLTWTEVAKQVDMTVSGAWSRHRRARPPKSPRLSRWQQVLADALARTLPLASEQSSLIISAERPPGLSSRPHDEPPTGSPHSTVPAYFTCRGRIRTPMQATPGIWC
jgi:hypothetical protein